MYRFDLSFRRLQCIRKMKARSYRETDFRVDRHSFLRFSIEEKSFIFFRLETRPHCARMIKENQERKRESWRRWRWIRFKDPFNKFEYSLNQTSYILRLHNTHIVTFNVHIHISNNSKLKFYTTSYNRSVVALLDIIKLITRRQRVISLDARIRNDRTRLCYACIAYRIGRQLLSNYRHRPSPPWTGFLLVALLRATTRIKGGGVYRLSRFMLISRYPGALGQWCIARLPRDNGISRSRRGNVAIWTGPRTFYHGEVYHSV